MNKNLMKKTMGVSILILFIGAMLNTGISATLINGIGNVTMSNLGTSVQLTDETVWWNTTEFSTEPYTAPFFEIYKLKDFGQCTYGLATADFNNDNWLDFAVGWTTSPNNYSGISIFYRNSDKSFRIENIKISGHEIEEYGHEIEDLEAVDFDNDGKVDIMCARSCDGKGNYSVNILWNDNGSFERETQVAKFNRSVGYWTNVHVAIADFDLDGDVDFIAGANCGKVKLFKNDGFENFSDAGVIFDYGAVSWGLDTGDFNDDGYPDFIVCAETEPGEYPFNDAGHIYLKLNDKTNNCFDNTTPGTHIASVPFPGDYTIGAAESGSVAVLDYNDDGLLDVVYGGDYKIYLLIQQNDGSYKPFYSCGLRDREYTWSDHLKEGGFTIGDFNYDGLDDIVVGGVQGTVRLLINNQTLVNIVKPEDRLLYFFGNAYYSLKFPGRKVIVGDIEVVASGLEPLNRVDFYLDDKLIHSDSSEPFTWNWTKFSFGKYTVIAEAYDANGQFAGKDTMIVWKFL